MTTNRTFHLVPNDLVPTSSHLVRDDRESPHIDLVPSPVPPTGTGTRSGDSVDEVIKIAKQRDGDELEAIDTAAGGAAA
jgi:hypothetical protein